MAVGPAAGPRALHRCATNGRQGRDSVRPRETAPWRFCSTARTRMPQAWRRALARLPGIDVPRSGPSRRSGRDRGRPGLARAARHAAHACPSCGRSSPWVPGSTGCWPIPSCRTCRLCRLVDGSMARQMSEFVLTAGAQIPSPARPFRPPSSARGRWSFALPAPPGATRVGIMGLGELGGHAAGVLRGARLHRTRLEPERARELAGCACFAGAEGWRPSSPGATSWSACCR